MDRGGFDHVNDVAPTLYEILGIRHPRAVYHDGWFASTFGLRVPWVARVIDISD